MNSILRRMKVMLICLLAIPLALACGGGGDDGEVDGGVGDGGLVIPQYTLSAEQEKLISNHGNPAYLTISVDSENGIREEAWTYLGEVEKMYVCWDGERVKEKSIGVDPLMYSNPPFINPALFTKETQKAHIIELFGDNYVFEDQSFEGSEAWYYTDLGLVVGFSGENLLVVQTMDKP